MAAPLRIDELTATGSLTATAAVAVVQGGQTLQFPASAFITQANSFTPSGTGAVSEDVQTAIRRFVHTAQYATQGNYETARDALTGTIGVPGLDVTGALKATTMGPHAIGGAPHSSIALRFGFGDASANQSPHHIGLLHNVVSAPGVNGSVWSLVTAANITKAASGTHPIITGIEADFPHITTAGAATITTIACIRAGADGAPPYAEATNVYAIEVVNGILAAHGGTNALVSQPAISLQNNRIIKWFDNAGLDTNGGFIWFDSSNILNIGRLGTTALQINSETVAAELRIGGTQADAGVTLRTTGTNRWIMYVPSGSTNLRFGDFTSDRLIIAISGVVTIPSLAGTGSRTVVADSTGALSAP